MNRIFGIFLTVFLLMSISMFASAESYIYGSDQTKPIYINNPDEDVTITLNGVNITSSSSTPAIMISKAKSVTIILANGSENKLKSPNNYAAIDNNNIQLTITCASAGEGHVCDDDCGKLTAIGGRLGAGIGGSNSKVGNRITISGGNITATGGEGAAGIGGGSTGNGNTITITGGNIIATGGRYAPGIGSGRSANASNILISGGKITATGGEYGAGIGGGYGVNNAENKVTDIIISGGSITAIGSSNGAGIGGGDRCKVNGIRISNGIVNAEGLVGIGGCGSNATTTDILISGGNVSAKGGNGAGIGSSLICDSGNITISGGVVKASGYIGIGGRKVEKLTISGGNITAIGEASGVGGTSPSLTSKIFISPASENGIKAKAGASEESAVELTGSPFMSGITNITDRVKNQPFFQTIGNSTLPDDDDDGNGGNDDGNGGNDDGNGGNDDGNGGNDDGNGGNDDGNGGNDDGNGGNGDGNEFELPETGDGANLMMWFAMLIFGAAAIISMRKQLSR